MSGPTEHTAEYNGLTISWDGDLEEGTVLEVSRPGGEPTAMPLHQLITMTNGDVLDALDT